ncbi:hypothetical protein OHA79_39075 [Streptomyces sp. NBC_00841]|nr:hypothetical protein [Streptomyces sp. NBC_00841]WSA03301.1 hypothetical protein OHA79_39075 [Streptomyces sp. NBC_00841]
MAVVVGRMTAWAGADAGMGHIGDPLLAVQTEMPADAFALV